MTPDRLRAWIRKRARGSISLQVVAETLTGFSEVCAFDTDDIKLMGADPEDDIAIAILEQCQEYTDGEANACKFAIQWMGKAEKVLRVAIHHCKPGPAKDDELTEIPKAIDATVIIRELLGALRVEREASVKERRVMTEGYEHIVKLLSAELIGQNKNRLAAERKVASIPEVVAEVEWTDEQREESIQRAAALKAFSNMAPEVGRLAMALIAKNFLDPVVDEVGEARAAAAAAREAAAANDGTE